MPEAIDDFGLSPVVDAAIRAVFLQHKSISAAIIFGSRAKGNYRPASDIDLDLTLTGDALTTDDLLRIASQIDELNMPYCVDLSILQQIEDVAVHPHIERVGKVFYSAATHQVVN